MVTLIIKFIFAYFACLAMVDSRAPAPLTMSRLVSYIPVWLAPGDPLEAIGSHSGGEDEQKGCDLRPRVDGQTDRREPASRTTSNRGAPRIRRRDILLKTSAGPF